MSAFDDEFGLFGDEEGGEEERRPKLGARKIATAETIIDDIEPEDEPAPRRRGARPYAGGRRERPPRVPLDPQTQRTRATELLEFLAKGLVSKPEAVHVVTVEDERGPIIELEVDPEDLGKVIGRGGRVAQALRTLVRAGAEGRVTVDIIDADEPDDEDEEAAETGETSGETRD
ncbi:MAG TPA: KH domain-containing protein [Candidatus Binatia bacterium]|nr:KH domain-containing protein [Candidatus Binatia bacterium]